MYADFRLHRVKRHSLLAEALVLTRERRSRMQAASRTHELSSDAAVEAETPLMEAGIDLLAAAELLRGCLVGDDIQLGPTLLLSSQHRACWRSICLSDWAARRRWVR